MNPDRYLARIGLDPERVRGRPADRETLARLQAAHVTTVPFETLSITGDPYGDRDGEGVTLDLPALYEKVAARRRGGFCFELNGLFGWLLSELGYDADRCAAMMLGDDGDPTPPANHHTAVVHLDRRYVVDVGMGIPTMRQPVPLDGESITDAIGVDWRVVESDRPDAEYLTQYRRPGDRDWSDRYVFTDTPRNLRYFEATCDFLATAPESTFTGDPVVTMATPKGHLKLTPETLTRSEDGEKREEAVDESVWDELLAAEFGLEYDSG